MDLRTGTYGSVLTDGPTNTSENRTEYRLYYEIWGFSVEPVCLYRATSRIWLITSLLQNRSLMRDMQLVRRLQLDGCTPPDLLQEITRPELHSKFLMFNPKPDRNIDATKSTQQC